MEKVLKALFDLDEEERIASLCDASGLQDGYSFRAGWRARRLAAFLIDDKGELKKPELDRLLAALEGQADPLSERAIKILKKLKQTPSFYQAIKKIGRPLCHRGAEALIYAALDIPASTALTDAEIRRAVLSACFTLLRQNVGSCFATAPAILVHEEQEELFLADLSDLLGAGKLKRTFGGVEYSVPLSPTPGLGDLRKTFIPRREHIFPGLIVAFEAAGVIDPFLTSQEKIAAQQKLLAPFFEKEVTAERLLRILLLRHFDVTEKEIESVLKKEEALFRKARSEIVQWPENGGKREQVQLLLLKERAAKAAFVALTDHPLLKAWEFSLASFAEVKMEFSKWNLYVSLGLHPEEKGGLGAVIYQRLEAKLQESNEKFEKYQREYEIAFDQLRATELLLKRAGTEAEIRRLQAEHRSRLHHLNACLEIRDESHRASARYSHFFSFLIEQFSGKFKEYFQELYDPEMREIAVGLYDDAPAGFRLVYKHGRSDATLWTHIHDADQWTSALIDFFVAVEGQIAAAIDWEAGKREIPEITSTLIAHLRSAEFLNSAMLRMKKQTHLIEGGARTPWSYVSGASMTSLLMTYFRREKEITEESKWVESETDLLIFFLDILKSLPPKITHAFLENPEKGMLASSPTHAFILKPGFPQFKEGWCDEGFTYTWVRDNVIHPAQAFYERYVLTPSQQQDLLEQLAERLPPLEGYRSKIQFSPLKKAVSIPQFREHLLTHVGEPRRDIIDAFLFAALPHPKPLLFADTNWANAYFAFVLNPGTGKLELWRCNRAGTEGMPMSSWKPWLDGTSRLPWSLLTHPNEYTS